MVVQQKKAATGVWEFSSWIDADESFSLIAPSSDICVPKNVKLTIV